VDCSNLCRTRYDNRYISRIVALHGELSLTHLTISLLGTPVVLLDDVPIQVDTRKAVALLAYLAMSSGPQSREVLAALLWPDNDGSSARAALRRTLSALNRALAGHALHIDRTMVCLLDVEGVWVDVTRFRRLVGRAGSNEVDVDQLAEAVALVRGDFMAGFALRDTPEFDDWQFFQAEGLRRELAATLDKLITGYVDRGQWDAAISQARHRLALDPLHEPAHRTLMELYHRTGQRSAALRQYRECVRVLEQELAVPPLEETTLLYQAIKERPEVETTGQARTLQHVPVPPTPVPPRHTGRTPLAGRAPEWEVLLKMYGACAHDGHVVAIEGEAGVGKTRLAEDFLTAVREQGGQTLAARCYQGETGLAYAPIVTLLRVVVRRLTQTGDLQALAPHVRREIARLLPEASVLRDDLTPVTPLDTPAAQARFLDSITSAIFAACDGHVPSVLFLDDVQWADAASVEALSYLTRRLQGHSLLVLLTWRTEEMPASHPLHQLVAQAQREDSGRTLSLGRLSRSAVNEWVAAVTGESANELAAQLYQETEGLPLFLGEYLHALPTDPGVLLRDHLPLPGGVRDVLHARLHRAGEAGQQLLSAGAVLGRSFDFDTLRAASGRDEETVIVGLEDLIAQGLVQELHDPGVAGSPVYDFYHEKLRALVYEETSLARRRLLHRRVAETLATERRGAQGPGARPGQIAHHLQLAGQETEAARWWFEAGEYARSLYANREALSHFQTALALGHPDEATLHEVIGDMHTLLGEYGSALQSYETAAAIAIAGSSTIERKLGDVYQRRGEWDLAESAYTSALEHACSVAERARLFADLSMVAYHQGQLDQAVDRARQALSMSGTDGEPQALAQAHNILGILTHGRGDQSLARDHLLRSSALAEGIGDAGIRAAALNNLALVYGRDGDVEAALAFGETALELCITQGDRHREAALHNNLADLLNAAGRTGEAIDHLKQAVTIYAEIGVEGGAVQPQIWKLAEW